jgi:hypothetical protein
LSSKKFAGLSLSGGRKEKVYFCVLEHYENEDRWFLSDIRLLSKEDGFQKGPISECVEEHGIKELIVDFPLNHPHCTYCKLDCPGEAKCSENSVSLVRDKITSFLQFDKSKSSGNPKKYEQDRHLRDEFKYRRDVLERKTREHLLSKPFKRRLKNGYLPYWNRPIDFWIWSEYYDQLLELFNFSYDSFGHTSLMHLNYFDYFKRHLPSDLKFYESSIYIILIELMKSSLISQKTLREYTDLDLGANSKLNIIKGLESGFEIFIYNKDMETLLKKRGAFDSFLLAIAGARLYKKQNIELPSWTDFQGTNFLVPQFLE